MSSKYSPNDKLTRMIQILKSTVVYFLSSKVFEGGSHVAHIHATITWLPVLRISILVDFGQSGAKADGHEGDIRSLRHVESIVATIVGRQSG